MTLDIRPADQRGRGEHGWLRSRHSFSFANYYDPAQMGFSDLLVINDDRVSPGAGFGTHPHRDMEIFSYVLDGSLAHRDTMDNGSVIRRGDVQLMSAGRGVAHSEFNPSQTEGVHFLQIWIVPAAPGGDPGYQQQHFSDADKRGCLRLILSPDGAQGSLVLRQDARVHAGLFNGDERARLTLPDNRHAYVHVAAGSIELNGVRLHAGDGARLRQAKLLEFSAGEQAEVLVFDLRPYESPR